MELPDQHSTLRGTCRPLRVQLAAMHVALLEDTYYVLLTLYSASGVCVDAVPIRGASTLCVNEVTRSLG